MKISALIVTRGNVDLKEVVAPLSVFDELIIWDNSKRVLDFGPFGLYVAAEQAIGEILYVQDDDCIVSSPWAIANVWAPGRIVCNMGKEYQEAYHTKRDKLMGFGSVFEKTFIRPTFARYLKHFQLDDVTLREPNRIFTALNHPRIDIVDVPITHMPYASDPDRLWKQPNHGQMRDEALRRCELVLKTERFTGTSSGASAT